MLLYVICSMLTLLVDSLDNINDQTDEAYDVSCQLQQLYSRYSGYNLTNNVYQDSDITGTGVNSEELLNKLSSKIETLIEQKEQSLLKKVAELERFLKDDYKYINLTYYDSDLGRKGGVTLDLTYNAFFEYHMNRTFSTVYIPVIVIQDSEQTLRDISWTRWVESNTLAPTENYFIGTTNGLLRFYPGAKWPGNRKDSNTHDMYDSRLQPWFLQAASASHDVALLIDKSGSVLPVVMTMITRMIKLLINIIPASYRFNVFLFNNETTPLTKCYGFAPLPATESMKKMVISELNDIEAERPGYLDRALTTLKKTFFSASLSGKSCERLLVLFTDGNMDIDVAKINKTMVDMKVKLMVVDFRGPSSPYETKSLKALACATGGQYVFIRSIAGWFAVADKFFKVVKYQSRAPIKHPQWIDPTVTFYEKKSIVLSLPIFNRTSETPSLVGVIGTEVLLKEFDNDVGYEGGDMIYSILSLRDGQVIRHPKLLTAPRIPAIDEVELTTYNIADEGGGGKGLGQTLFPFSDASLAPLAVMSYYSNTLKYASLRLTLVIPRNDKLNLTMSGKRFDKVYKEAERSVYSELGKRLFIRGSSNDIGYKFQPDTEHSVEILENCNSENSTTRTLTLKRNCLDLVSYTLPILKDIVSTSDTALFWNKTDRSSERSPVLGQFLITRRGVMRTNLKDVVESRPSYYPEWTEYAVDPSKIPTDNLLISRPIKVHRGGGRGLYNVSKSIIKVVDGKKAVLAVVGVSARSGVLQNLFQKALNIANPETVKYVIDHKGYIVYSSRDLPTDNQFFGLVEGAAFKILVNRGYFTVLRFRDCMDICDDESRPKSSSARLHSIFLLTILSEIIKLGFNFFTIASITFPGVQGFIRSDILSYKPCCRNINAYERNFNKLDVFMDTFNSCDINAQNTTSILVTSCMGTLSVAPIPKTNLLLVTIIRAEPACICTKQVLLPRVERGLNYSYCEKGLQSNNYDYSECVKDSTNFRCSAATQLFTVSSVWTLFYFIISAIRVLLYDVSIT